MSDQKPRRSALHRAVTVVCVLLVFAMIAVAAYSFRRSLLSMHAAERAASAAEATTETTTTETTTTTRFPQAATRTTKTVTLADETLVLAHNAALIRLDADGAELIAARAEDEQIYPASLTKIMTLVTYLELCGTAQLDSITEMKQEVLDTAHYNAASCAGFFPGELCTVRDLLYGLMLPSGADAALTLANLASGSEAAFVGEMNRLAVEMGLTKTHFVNCIGLHDEQHVSSVQDIACILRYALTDPLCTEIMSAAQYTTASTYQHAAGIKLKSTVLSRMSAAELPPGARTLSVLGGKTGYTDEAGQCLATFADAPDGTRYVCVVAGCAPKQPMDAVYDTLTLYQLDDRSVTEITRLVPPEPEQTDITETAALIE